MGCSIRRGSLSAGGSLTDVLYIALSVGIEIHILRTGRWLEIKVVTNILCQNQQKSSAYLIAEVILRYVQRSVSATNMKPVPG